MTNHICMCKGSPHTTSGPMFDWTYYTSHIPFWTDESTFCAKTSNYIEDFHELFPDGSNECDPDQQIDPIQLAADFYLLEAAKNRVLGDNDSETYAEQATTMFETLVAHATPLMHNYAWWAICSELTYHPNFKYAFNASDWQPARAGWQKLIDHYGEELACDWAIEMFLQDGTWGGGFGGKPWAAIVEVVRYKAIGKIGKKPFSDAMFLDRLFSLQHNSCTVFNKVTWNYVNDWGTTIDRMVCKCDGKPDCGCINVLNMHALGDLNGLMALASHDVRDLIKSIWFDSGYGTIEETKSPYAKQAKYYGTDKSYVDVTKDYGTVWCWGCDKTLEKASSKQTGFCTTCRAKFGGTDYTKAEFWSKCGNDWEDGVNYEPSCGDPSCNLCAPTAWKEKLANSAYAAYLFFVFPKKNKKKPVYKKPVYKPVSEKAKIVAYEPTDIYGNNLSFNALMAKAIAIVEKEEI